MALEIPEKMTREEWDKLPEHQKPIFIQSESDAGVFEYYVPQMHNSMRNAKAEREAEKKAREAAEAKLKPFEKMDPEKIADLMSREAMIKEGTKTMEEAILKANRDAEEKWRGLVDEGKKEIASLRAQRIRDHESNLLASLIGNSNADTAYKDEIMMSFGRQLKTEERDGRLVTYVMDPQKPGELAKDPQTFDPMSVERAFQIFREQKAKFFKGDTSDQSGAGFNGGRSGGFDSFDSDPLEWDFATKKSFFDSMGTSAQAAYNKKLQVWATKRQKKAS